MTPLTCASPALLVLEDQQVIRGISVGKNKSVLGEIIFNTSLTGYQEILTDPSYAGQVVCFTNPHIGNVGVNSADMESDLIRARGVVIRNLPTAPSNWRAESSFEEFLVRHEIGGIAKIDTRALVRNLRLKGSQKACIIPELVTRTDALHLATSLWNEENNTLLSEVSTKEIRQLGSAASLIRLVIYDFGVKNAIINNFLNFGCALYIVPWNTSPAEVLALNPTGIVLSNGPGDPRTCEQAINATRVFLNIGIPILGICLGHQILALACGANIYKMKFGHHGSNHPAYDLNKKTTFITNQNHCYAVDQETLPKCLRITYYSLFDGTIQGIKHLSKPAFGFQGHPEGSPGPHDLLPIFQDFFYLLASSDRYMLRKELSHA